MKEVLSRETQRRLAILDALEAGGVDNWEFYDVALETVVAEIRIEEAIEDIATDILDDLVGYVNQPAGSGCGYGFESEASDVIFNILNKRKGELK